MLQSGMVRSKQTLRDSRKLFLLIAFFISGATALIFEVVFRRELLFALGVTHYSVGTVLAVFMAGLGAGSILFGSAADGMRSPARVFGCLQIGIGILGLLLTNLKHLLDGLYIFLLSAISPGGNSVLALKILLAGAVLFPPTLLMGGTFPVLSRLFARPAESSGSSLGLLYALNTLGGVAGTALATFWLLGGLGSSMALLVFSIISIVMGIGTLALGAIGLLACGTIAVGELALGNLAGRTVSFTEKGEAARENAIAYMAFFISGFTALSLEVYWTRILAYVIGSHGYAFGIILSAFLAGIAAGSLSLSTFADRLKDPIKLLGLILSALSAAALGASAALYRMTGLSGLLAAASGKSWPLFIGFEAGAIFTILLLPTFAMGAGFPVVMSVLTRNHRQTGRAVGRAYALNTLGSIAGALLAGFVFIEKLGISNGIKISLFSALLSGTAIIQLGRKPAALKPAHLAAFALFAAFAAVFPLSLPLQKLAPGERLIFYEESSSATVAVREDAGESRMLSINGLDEVPVDLSSLLTFRTLAHLPLLLQQNPREIMVLSLGGGITTGSVSTHGVQSIDAVELCPPVARAAAYFTEWNHDVLGDRRLTLIFQDGRNHLLTTRKAYDIITADATHPWSADSWILYTREFYELARARLAPSGYFCQWVPLHYLSADDYRCILRTMRAVFPRLTLWYTGSYTIALGSVEPLEVDLAAIARRMELPQVRDDLRSVGITSPVELLSLFLMDEGAIDEFAGSGPLNTDDRAYLEHSAARSFGRETTPENLAALLEFRRDSSALFGMTVEAESSPAGAPDRALKKSMERLHSSRGISIEARIATYRGNFAGSVELYRSALAEAPDDAIGALFLEDAEKTLAAYFASEGDSLRRKGQAGAAAASYFKALALDYDEPRAHNGLGLMLFSERKFDEALSHYDAALKIMKNDAQIRYNRVIALLKLGKLTEAEDEIEKIEELEKQMTERLSPRLRMYLKEIKKVR